MKKTLTYLFFLSSFLSIGQLKSGFNVNEAKFTIAMCNSFNFKKQFGSTETIMPKEFKLTHTSDILSMDNKFQIYENGKTGVIVYRGSTEKAISWVENCYSAMIPAKGNITIKDVTNQYCFTNKKNAAVHAGYALSIVILSDKIIEPISLLNERGIYDIIITGHSQGGALATLTRAYLEHLPKNTIANKNKFKTYSYAQPMCGNKEFSIDYNKRYSSKETSYFIKNSKDPIPNMPFNYEEGKLISKAKIKGWLFGKKKFNAKKLGQDSFIRLFEKGLIKYVKGTNKLLNNILSLKFGKIQMPKFISDINYYPTGKIKEIDAFTYPKVVVDITNSSEKELKTLIKGDDGKWYKKETTFFQHKPYNYYVYVLKKWDSNAYNALPEKYLVSDL